jgi:hypothetical protein
VGRWVGGWVVVVVVSFLNIVQHEHAHLKHMIVLLLALSDSRTSLWVLTLVVDAVRCDAMRCDVVRRFLQKVLQLEPVYDEIGELLDRHATLKGAYVPKCLQYACL